MMMVGPGEQERYLPFVLKSLAGFCDDVILGDGQDFFAHEGRARQRLLETVLAEDPTHILAIDADELVTDGWALRAAAESGCPIQTLWLEEIWGADEAGLNVRMDGGWRSHGAPVCFRVPDQLDDTWRIQDRELACGREPMAVRSLMAQDCYEYSGVGLLHFGWANVGERAARYERYHVADNGRFHARAHLESIMWPDERVTVERREWPAELDGMKAALVARVAR